MEKQEKKSISFFQRFLSLWVLLCMGIGVLIGHFLPGVATFLSKLQVAQINLPIALLVWLMIFPMMLKVDFASIKNVGKKPKGLILTWVMNWLVKPFTMFGLACLFMYLVYGGVISANLQKDYVAGMVLLGAAPCTAMVFVWSSLVKGDPAYTLMQVATNDLIILFAFVPIVGLLLGVGGFSIPWLTLFLSIVLFVVVPLVLAVVIRLLVVKKKGQAYLDERVIPKFSPFTTFGLLLMLILLFTMQADLIIKNPLHILLIAVPLILQTFLIFGLTFGMAKVLKLPYETAAPAGFVGASNFFELAVAVAIALFPNNPGVSLATTVGVLTEVPTMLVLVKIAEHFKPKFEIARHDGKKEEKTRV
mgnify:CR=1 FL=1